MKFEEIYFLFLLGYKVNRLKWIECNPLDNQFLSCSNDNLFRTIKILNPYYNSIQKSIQKYILTEEDKKADDWEVII